MKNSNILPVDTFTDNEDLSPQFNVRLYHIVFTAMLLVAWAWLGTVLIR